MLYTIYPGNVDTLEGKLPFGDGECVALVQATTPIGHTSGWRPGPRVVDLSFLNPGTVIANFIFDKKGVGRFPNRHGYHAALFIEFGGRGMSSGRYMSFHVMDQWRGRTPLNIVKRREIESKGKSHADGNIFHDSDNAEQFYVVVQR